MSTECSHFKRLLIFVLAVLSQGAVAVPTMTTGQSGSDIFVRAHNFENRTYICSVEFSWTGDGMPPNVNHTSTSTVPANSMNFLIAHYQTNFTNVRITSGPTMLCYESV